MNCHKSKFLTKSEIIEITLNYESSGKKAINKNLVIKTDDFVGSGGQNSIYKAYLKNYTFFNLAIIT